MARDLYILGAKVSWTLYSIFLKRWPTSFSPIAVLVLIDSGGVLVLLTSTAINGCRRFVWRTHNANHMGLENSCARCSSYAHTRRGGISGIRNAAKGTRRGTCWAHPVFIAPVCRSGSRRFFGRSGQCTSRAGHLRAPSRNLPLLTRGESSHLSSIQVLNMALSQLKRAYLAIYFIVF